MNKSFKYYLLFILIGGIGGTFVGEILGNHFSMLSFLKVSYNIGTAKPFVIDFKILSFTFGLNININLMSIVCMILAIIIYKKVRK
ncbi:DUF4321 domain-containing protein [Clostridium hydrogenum]|uniref:DUF4321 domain-containing protein n=1 Tax=Clostridium hydrogenum TaxID=2855764 RepID=UPI002E334082|nr:DUF4321 domain-containing protein [Clostridium hydrogenum]